MQLTFQYFNETSNVEFNDPNRVPIDISYTIITERTFFSPESAIMDLFGGFNLTTFFDNLENILDSNIEQYEPVVPKVTKESLTALGPYKRVTGDSEITQETCSICLENFKINEGYRKLNCNHVFHKKCIDKWFLSGHRECPMCREDAWSKSEK